MTEPSATRSAGGPGFYVKWIALPLIATIVAGGIVLARELSLRSQRGELEQQAARGRTVLCTKLHVETAARTIMLPGEVDGFYETPIYAKISGYVKQMFVDKGALVKAGQLVAIIESPETDEQVRNAKATYDLAKVTDDRNQVLVKNAVIPQQTADESHLTMRADLASWKSLVATQQYERVYAPFDGMISVRNLYPAALVATGTASGTSNPSIYQIATLNQLRVYVYLPQTYAPFVRDGEQSVVTVNEYPDPASNATVTRHPSSLYQRTR